VGDRGDVLAVDRFGASAPGSVMLREYGFTVDNVCTHALAMLRKRPSAVMTSVRSHLHWRRSLVGSI